MSKVAGDQSGGETLVGIVTREGDGRRLFLRLTYGIAALAVLALLAILCLPLYSSLPLKRRAAGLMKLPKDAKVVAVREGDRASEGVVEFRLPEAIPGSRLDEVWGLNATSIAMLPMVSSTSGAPPRLAIGAPAGASSVAVASKVPGIIPPRSTSTSTIRKIQVPPRETYRLEYDAANHKYIWSHENPR